MNMETNDEEMNYERAKVFSKEKIKVHISKTNGVFYNGIITKVEPDYFFLIDEEDGEQLVFFVELAIPIKRYVEEGE